MSRALDTFSEAGDDIVAIIEPQEAVLSQLAGIDEALADRLSELLAKAAGVSNIVVDKNGIAISHLDQCSAFYGDRGAPQKKCVEAGIPAMIQNVDA